MGGFFGALGSLWVEIGAKISNFESNMAAVSKQIDTTISEAESKFSGFDKIGSKLTGVGTGLAAAITLPVLGIGAAAISASGDFDSAMRLVSARGDITGGDLAKLKKQSEDLGAATQFSSKQAAEGMAEFAGAGFKVNEIYAAMPGTLNLAAAAGTSIGQAATVVKDLLGQFGLSAQDTGKAVDVLAKASNEGSGTLMEMANSLKYAGPVARAAGLDIEQTSSALLVLDKAGIRGEMAGTALRGMLASLQGPSGEAAKTMQALGISVTDASGKMLPFPAIIDQFKNGLAKIPNEADRAANLVQIFGREGLAAANVLVKSGSPALLEFEQHLRNSAGEAERTASVMNSGMGGALERMKGSIETAAQKIGDVLAPTVIQLAGYLESGANKVAEFAGWFAKLPEPIQTTTIAVVAMAAALGPLLIVAGQFAGAIASINTVLPLMSAGIAAVTKFLGIGLGALTAYTVGIGLAVAAIGTIIYKYNQWQDAQAEADKAADQQAAALIRLERYLTDHGKNVAALKDEYKKGQISQLEYERGLQSLAKELGNTQKKTETHTKTLTDAEKIAKANADAQAAMAKATAAAGNESKKATDKVKPLRYENEVLEETVRQLTAQYNKGLSELVKWKLAHQDAASTTPKLTATTKELDDAIQSMVSNAKLIAPAFLDAGKQAQESMAAAVKPVQDLDAAYRTLGITSTKSLQDQATEASKAYQTIKDSGKASAEDIDRAWVKMEEARIDAAKAAGQQIPAETEATLKAVKDKLSGHTTETKGLWSDWSNQVSTIITDLGKNISDALWDGSQSWGQKGMNILKSLGESVTRAFVEPATKAIGDLISGAISDLIGGKGFGGILDKVKELGSSVKDVFSGVSSGAGGAASSAGGGSGIPGTSGGSGGGAGSGLGGAMGITNMVTGAISAISGVIGNFQNAHQETSLNAIEHNTRYSMMYLGERGDGGILGRLFDIADKMQYVPGLLDGLNLKLDTWLQPLNTTLLGVSKQLETATVKFTEISTNTQWGSKAEQDNGWKLEAMLNELRNISGRQPIINVYVNGVQAPASNTNIKMQGVLAL